MRIEFRYRDVVTQMLWMVAGVTNGSVIVKGGSPVVCRYIPRDEFVWLTNSGKFVAV